MLIRLGLLRAVSAQLPEAPPETLESEYYYDDLKTQAAHTDDAETIIYEVQDEE